MTLPPGTMTRAAVAKRLHISVASVRRLEANGILTPYTDDAGVHLFDIGQVEQVAVQRGMGPAAAGPGSPAGMAELAVRVAQLEHRLDQVITAVNAWIAQLQNQP